MRYAISWAFFKVGHAISRVMRQGEAHHWLWPAYNRTMILSLTIQGTGRGPWTKPEASE